MRPLHLAVPAVMLAAAVALTPALAAQGAPGKAASKPAAVKVTTSVKAAAKPVTVKVTKTAKPVKPVKVTKPVKVQFTVNGTVAAVDPVAVTVTVDTTAGMKDLRGRTLVVTVAPTAKVVVDDVRAPLSAVTVGSQATVVGVRTGDAFTATKVSATSPVEEPPVVDEPVTP